MPGLISSEAFSTLCQAALTDDEFGKLSTALAMDRATSISNRSRSESPNLRLLSKVNDYLRRVRDQNPAALEKWVKSHWTRKNTDGRLLDVVKAYLNVLEAWRYPFSWKLIKDARDKEWALLVLADGNPSHFILEEDIGEICGRPHEFYIWMNGVGTGIGRIGGGTWSFHYEDGAFQMQLVDHQQPTESRPLIDRS